MNKSFSTHHRRPLMGGAAQRNIYPHRAVKKSTD